MSDEAIKVLMIDDNPAAISLMQYLLEDAKDVRVELEHASRLESGIARLTQGGIDVVLLDILLPDSKGFRSFTDLHKAVPDVPVIILSGIDDEALALKMVSDGAQDYLVKGEVTTNLLVRTIRCAIERTRGEAPES
jgi:two-component system cell cycle sensor histidine kinase/response regulator CckA